jgi:hypothetical protein
MNALYILAALLAFCASAGHSWLGEKFILGPLLKSEPLPGILKPEINRRLVRYVWHLPSVLWAVLGCYMLWAGLAGEMSRPTAIILGALFVVSGIANMAAVRRFHFGWALLFSIAAALWIGAFAF